MPLCILSSPTVMRRLLVSSCFAEVTQQIHSLRASGVMSAHNSLAIESDSIARRKSFGMLCTGPDRFFAIADMPKTLTLLLAAATSCAAAVALQARAIAD